MPMCAYNTKIEFLPYSNFVGNVDIKMRMTMEDVYSIRNIRPQNGGTEWTLAREIERKRVSAKHSARIFLIEVAEGTKVHFS